MIIVTGAYGFIGSCLVKFLNQQGITDIVAVDDFSKKNNEPNLADTKILQRVERDDLFDFIEKNNSREGGTGSSVSFIFHLGARTDTTEFDWKILEKLNLEYSKGVFLLCTKYAIPIIYASSAATYGNGELGYSDATLPKLLTPLNPYGKSKNDFDQWLLDLAESRDELAKKSFFNFKLDEFPFWAGFKFFNVYGPNEYQKGRMASTIFHFTNQIQATGAVNLFKSHNPKYADGGQMRDFVYVKDVVNVLFWFYKNYKSTPSVKSGIYNLGTGKARTFNDLVANVFKNVDKPLTINYVPTPEDIRDKYQYFTEADMSKVKNAGYDVPFMSLEEGIKDYVQNYLLPKKQF
jgi:ADP-L-glycero-D-manno-heptose 6-epimerase